ncbi:MAG TPA: hypothetical protein VIU12_34990 [Chryseolinea sp.]
MEELTAPDKPNFHKRLFWEFEYEAMDWRKQYAVVIERIIERGTEQEWKELIRFYGKEKVVDTLQKETNYLPDETIERVAVILR